MRSFRTVRVTVLVTVAPLLLATAGLMHPRHLTASTAGHWAGMHIALLPVFPLLVLGLVVLWGSIIHRCWSNTAPGTQGAAAMCG